MRHKHDKKSAAYNCTRSVYHSDGTIIDLYRDGDISKPECHCSMRSKRMGVCGFRERGHREHGTHPVRFPDPCQNSRK